jgi:heme-degrading monooxygenase HmoA
MTQDAAGRFVNVAEWASEQDCKAAVSAPAFREAAVGLREFPGRPGFYTVVFADQAG